MLKVGFIGLGNVGGKLAGSLLRNGVDLTVRDLDSAIAQPFLDGGAKWADSPREMAQKVDVLITCLPSPAASALVMEAEDGALTGFGPGKIWAEMSTTDKDEVLRLGEKVRAVGAEPVDCPVSGGCHRAATGNIAIFAGCERTTFETMLPLLTTMGRRILHTGELGYPTRVKGAHQLPRHRQSAKSLRSSGYLQNCRHGPEHDLRGDPDFFRQFLRA